MYSHYIMQILDSVPSVKCKLKWYFFPLFRRKNANPCNPPPPGSSEPVFITYSHSLFCLKVWKCFQLAARWLVYICSISIKTYSLHRLHQKGKTVLYMGRYYVSMWSLKCSFLGPVLFAICLNPFYLTCLHFPLLWIVLINNSALATCRYLWMKCKKK